MEVFVVLAKPYPYDLPWGDDGEREVIGVFKSYLKAEEFREAVQSNYYSTETICKELE